MEKHIFSLPDDHGWKAQAGCKLFVADRGAYQLEFPQDWHVQIGPSIKFTDKVPPDDDCCLEVSLVHLPFLDIERVPMQEMLLQALQGEKGFTHFVESRTPNYRQITAQRQGLDVPTGRAARYYYSIALCSKLYVFLSFCLWESDVERFLPVWSSVLESLKLGQVYRDPFSGQVIDPLAN
jgi:hypothetical protein